MPSDQCKMLAVQPVKRKASSGQESELANELTIWRQLKTLVTAARRNLMFTSVESPTFCNAFCAQPASICWHVCLHAALPVCISCNNFDPPHHHCCGMVQYPTQACFLPRAPACLPHACGLGLLWR